MPSQQWNTKKVIYLSMLVALQIILSRVFSINAWNIRIGFGFIPMIFAILYFGTKEGVLVAILSDLLGGLFLSSYPYFPGYTLSLSSSPYHAYSFDSDFHQWKYAILYDSIYGVYSGKSSFFAGV